MGGYGGNDDVDVGTVCTHATIGARGRWQAEVGDDGCSTTEEGGGDRDFVLACAV